MRQPPLPPSMDDGSGIQEFIDSGSNDFDPASEDFLEQILSSVTNGGPWVDIDPAIMIGGGGGDGGSFEDKVRHRQQLQQQQLSYGSKGLMLQQQLFPSRGVNGGSSMSILNADLNDNDSSSFSSANMGNDASVKALLNGFAGSIGQAQQFHHAQQAQNFGTAVSGGSTGGGGAGQPKQPRVRARRGQATDPHSIAERLRRERIAERMKSLQELVPNANKTDKASMLDEIIDYVKFLQLQVKVLSMSRLGGASAAAATAVAPLNAYKSSSESRNGNGAQTASSSNEGIIATSTTTVTEQQVAKLMDEDMGSAMQYLQGKGLCLMPISLATAISTATCQSSRINNNKQTNNANAAAAGGPTSPGVSASTVQSAPGDATAKAE